MMMMANSGKDTDLIFLQCILSKSRVSQAGRGRPLVGVIGSCCWGNGRAFALAEQGKHAL